jgi:hypothetical protein
MIRLVLAVLLLLSASSARVSAGLGSKAAREAAEHLLGRFGKEMGEESVETLAEKIGKYGAKYGDDAIGAIKKAGPRGFRLLDDAGESAPEVIRLVTRYGNDAVWVASRPGKLAVFVKYGEEAAEAMIKHPGISAPVIERFGKPAAHAIRNVSRQNARRIAMMADDGSLVVVGKADGLLEVIGKYGDKGANFVWKHKGALALVTVASAFLADPQPFINGTRDLAEIAIQPVNSAAREVGKGVAERTNWTLVITCGVSLLALFLWWRKQRAQRRLRGPASSELDH